jgi:hypothetical protein
MRMAASAAQGMRKKASVSLTAASTRTAALVSSRARGFSI